MKDGYAGTYRKLLAGIAPIHRLGRQGPFSSGLATVGAPRDDEVESLRCSHPARVYTRLFVLDVVAYALMILFKCSCSSYSMYIEQQELES